MKIGLLVFAAFLGFSAGAALQAQTLRAEVTFEFTAGGKLMPAGVYRFTPVSNQKSIRIEGPENRSIIAMVTTRMASAIHTTPKDSHIVFDKVGQKYFLSEIWIPQQDGYALYNTGESHEHQVLDVPPE